jgi:hypothetical protein
MMFGLDIKKILYVKTRSSNANERRPWDATKE